MRRIAVALLLAAVPAMPQATERAPLKIPDRVGVSQSQRQLTLADAIELALRNNLQIEIDRTVIDEFRENFFGARGWLDPHFRVSPRVEHRTTATSSSLIGTDGKLEQDIGTIDAAWDQKLPWWGSNVRVALENSRQSTTNPFEALTPFNTAKLGATLTVPFTRNRAIDRSRAALRVTNKQVELSETQFEASVINIVSAVEEAYWNLVASRQNVKVTSEAVDLAREQLARTQRMIDSGTLAPVELAAAEAELERRIDTWYASIGLVTQVENAVKILLTKDSADGMWDEELAPTEEDTLRPPEFDTVRAAVDLAFSKRPELRQVDLQTETNDIQKQLARNETKTQVDFVGGVSFAGLSGAVADTSNPFSGALADQFVRVSTLSALHGLPPVPVAEISGVTQSLVGSYGRMWDNLFQGKFPTAFAGVQIDFTARNRAAKAELAKTLVAERRLKLQRDQVEQMITAEVRNALQAIQTARQRIQAADASARAAQEKLESETRLFRNGESTNFLVLTRQNELADSRQRAVVARLDFNKAVAGLQKALGTTLQTHSVELQ